MGSMLKMFKSKEGQVVDEHSHLAKWLQPFLVRVDEGEIEVEVKIKDEMTNSVGILHGGVTAMIMDEVLGSLTFTVDIETFFATSNLNVHYLSNTQVGETIVVKGQVNRQGRNLINAEAKMYHKATGKLMAVASADLAKTRIPLPI